MYNFILYTHTAWVHIMAHHPWMMLLDHKPFDSAQGSQWTVELKKAGLSLALREDYVPASM